MIKIRNKILALYRSIITSIAFFPSIIALGGFLSVFIITLLRNHNLTQYIIQPLPQGILVQDIDTASTILSIIIGGMFSLTVFSFSMVMVVLNQAASSFSPRLLPGLISNKRHQIVLGFYLGTLIYCIFTLINISPNRAEYELDEFAILYAILLCITSLGLFVYFIHSISQEVQISNILSRIFNDTKTQLQILKETESRKADKFPNTSDWQELHGIETGYFQDFTLGSFIDLGNEHDTVFYIIPPKGMFVLEKTPIVKSKRTLDEDTIQAVLSCLQFSNTELVQENYILGFKQITEIALKAMSPGINDPGTAVIAIDHLTALFSHRMQIDDTQSYKSGKDIIRVHLHVIKFEELIYSTMASLRQYCKHDVLLVKKLLKSLKYLQLQNKEKENYTQVIHEEIDTLLADANANLQNKKDLQVIHKLALQTPMKANK